MYSSSYRMANVQGRFFNRLSISARKVKDQHKVEYNGRRGLSNNIWRNKIFTVSTHSSNPAFIYRDSDAPLRKIVRKKEIRHYWPMRNDSHYDLQYICVYLQLLQDIIFSDTIIHGVLFLLL